MLALPQPFDDYILSCAAFDKQGLYTCLLHRVDQPDPMTALAKGGINNHPITDVQYSSGFRKERIIHPSGKFGRIDALIVSRRCWSVLADVGKPFSNDV